MKFSIGDKVLLIPTNEEGIVIDFIGTDMLEVEVNGVRFPIYIADVDHPYLKWFTEKSISKKPQKMVETLVVEQPKQRPTNLAKGIYLSFIPVFRKDEIEDIVDNLKIHLLNELPVSISFRYEVKLTHSTYFILEGNLHPFANIYLHSIDLATMNDQPRFHWQFEDEKNKHFKTEEGILKIKSTKLFQHIDQLLRNNEPSFSYLLISDFVEKPKKTDSQPSFHVVPSSPKAQNIKLHSLSELPRNELDLHIEELIDNVKGLSNDVMLHIQLNALEKYIHLAILHHLDRMYVIHGVGAGVLKKAVHDFLTTVPEVKYFKNEWMGKYGYGATLVVFKK